MNLARTGVSSRIWQWRVAAAGAAAACTVGMVASPAVADGTAPPTPGIVSPSSTVQGRTYSQWSATQWQWTLQQPNVMDSPVVDPNPGTTPAGTLQLRSGSSQGLPSCRAIRRRTAAAASLPGSTCSSR